MSVTQTDVVDAIGVEASTGKVILTISDHLGWEAEEEHLYHLREKLNTYLGFVESGELLVVFPKAAGKDVAVDIVARVEPSSAGVRFPRNATEATATAGFELRFRVLRKPS